MPIFQDDFGGGHSTPPGQQLPLPAFNTTPERESLRRKISEESIRTELCEGLVLDGPQLDPTTVEQPDVQLAVNGTSDRGELIERLKRGESPTWVPNPNVREQPITHYLQGLLTNSKAAGVFAS